MIGHAIEAIVIESFIQVSTFRVRVERTVEGGWGTVERLGSLIGSRPWLFVSEPGISGSWILVYFSHNFKLYEATADDIDLVSCGADGFRTHHVGLSGGSLCARHQR